jgi:SAM-dependent methyltransferase
MDNWIDYWNRKDSMENKQWQIQSRYVVNKICKEFSFDKDKDVLLDIGCGHGYIINGLSGFVKQAYGVDTSEINIDMNKDKFRGTKNLFFYKLPIDDYLGIDKLPIKNVTHAIIVSVIQYYKSLDEVRLLISNLKKIMAQGGTLLLADLQIDYSLIKDIVGVLLGGLASGTFFLKLFEIASGKHNIYTRIRAKNPILTMTRKDLEMICKQENVSLRFIKREMTTSWFRKSVTIKF